MNGNHYKSKPSNEVQIFFWFIFLCVLLSASIQWLGLPSIDHDELEAVRWGATKSWFVDKHPPLVGFIAFYWAEFTLYSNFAFFILSKLNALLAVFIIYKLNRQFLSKHLSLIATASYTSTYAYIVLMSQLDANGILHSLWPLFVIILWKSLTKDKYQYWILLGAIGALTILGKYQSVMLLLTALTMILSIRNFREHILNFKLWIALLVFITLLTPHFLTYFGTNYSMTEYVLSSSKQNEYFYGRWSIITFILNQILISLFGFYILIWTVRKNINFPDLKPKDDKALFLFFMALVLPAAPILFSLFSGVSVLGSWGLTSWFLFPTLILYLFKGSNLKLSLKPYFFLVPSYLIIMSSIIILNNFYAIARPTSIPAAMKEIELKWFEQIDNKPHTVITNSRPAQGMIFYSKSKPQVINSESPSQFSWLLDSNKCTDGPTLIISEQNIKGDNFMKKMEKQIGKPKFYKLIFTKTARHKITLTKPLEFQISGYSKPVCFKQK